MSLVTTLIAATGAPVPVEEEIALADELLRQGASSGATFFGQHAGWLSFLGLVVLAVAVMLIILAGRYRRRGDDFAFQEEPLFDEETAQAAYEDDRYAEVVIEDEVDRSGFAQVMETESGYQGHNFEGDEEPMADHDDDIPRDREHEPGEVYADDEGAAEAHPNVVPLRSAPEDTRYAAQEEEPESSEPEEVEEEQTAPRYAFATGRAAAAETNFTQSASNEPEAPGAMQGSLEDRDRPFVAPFIRDDIERAERRQADRVDRLRDDFAHQFDTMKQEQSSRLDLVIAAIDRKLDSLDRHHAERAVPAPVVGNDEISRHVNSLNDQVARVSASI
ncbi:MAG: hypothetical protein AAGA69_00990, partial [Pseudomonadota bacterium]